MPAETKAPITNEQAQEVRALLTAVYEKWIALNHLPLAAAEEVLYGSDLTREQYAWLTSFIDLWDATEATK